MILRRLCIVLGYNVECRTHPTPTYIPPYDRTMVERLSFRTMRHCRCRQEVPLAKRDPKVPIAGKGKCRLHALRRANDIGQ